MHNTGGTIVLSIVVIGRGYGRYGHFLIDFVSDKTNSTYDNKNTRIHNPNSTYYRDRPVHEGEG